LASTSPYGVRRQRLKEFVERHWVPDARLLGGIFTQVAHPMSLDQFAEKGVRDSCTSVEFIPEQEGRRRLVVYLEGVVKAATGPAAMKQVRSMQTVRAEPMSSEGRAVSEPPVADPAAALSAPLVPKRRARAVPVEKMPDVYDLFGEDGFPISRASVQQFAVSQQIRGALATAGQAKTGVWVQARWRQDFGGYEIEGLA
jgi:hypothetical protein